MTNLEHLTETAANVLYIQEYVRRRCQEMGEPADKPELTDAEFADLKRRIELDKLTGEV